VDGSNAISFDEYDPKDFAFWVNGFDRREKKSECIINKFYYFDNKKM
jgi:hypothetical protein